MEQGCDCYDIVRLLCDTKHYSLKLLCNIMYHEPIYQKIGNVNYHSVRGMIPKWSSTKYRTAPIEEVVDDILNRIEMHRIGYYVYNSNLNPQNSKAPNSIYLLLITDTDIHFLDINSRRKYRICKEDICDSYCTL